MCGFPCDIRLEVRGMCQSAGPADPSKVQPIRIQVNLRSATFKLVPPGTVPATEVCLAKPMPPALVNTVAQIVKHAVRIDQA